MQRVDVYRTAENTDEWAASGGASPSSSDECAYEGDIDQGWGNVTGEEMTRRFWEGAVRGGYVATARRTCRPPVGEAVMPASAGTDDEVLWWGEGRRAATARPPRGSASSSGSSPRSPGACWTPHRRTGTALGAGTDGTVRVAYFGFNRPRFRTVLLGDGDWVIESSTPGA